MGIVHEVGPNVKSVKKGDRVVACFDIGCAHAAGCALLSSCATVQALLAIVSQCAGMAAYMFLGRIDP